MAEPMLVPIAIIVVLIIVALVLYFMYRKRTQAPIVEEEPVQEYPMDYMRKEFRCPNCNEPTDPVASSCYNCGALFQEGEFECPNCNEPVDPDMLECPKCGEVLEPEPSVCPKCGKVVKLDSTQCDRCGETFWSPLIKPAKEEVEEKPKKKVAAE